MRYRLVDYGTYVTLHSDLRAPVTVQAPAEEVLEVIRWVGGGPFLSNFEVIPGPKGGDAPG